MLILAAGEGTRLRPLTDSTPKPMLEIAGRPILEHNVRLAARYGLREIAINLYHRPQTIVEHFGDGSRFDVRIVYSHERALLGTAGAINPLRAWLGNDRLLVVYGDNLTTCDLAALAARHVASGAAATIALYRRDDVTASGIAEIDDAGFVRRFVEKPAAADVFSNWVNAGLLLLEPSALDHVARTGTSDFGRDVLPEFLRRGLPVAAYPMTEELYWIDSHRDYAATRATFARLRPSGRDA